jgi:hypothetical protein
MKTHHNWRALVFGLGLTAASASLHAQHDAGANSAPAEAKQFDFLRGEWELTITPKVNSLVAMIHGSPKVAGTWKAWPEFDGFGIEDELRIVDASGNPMSLNHTLRVYDAGHHRWNILGADVYRGNVSTSTALWSDGEMRISGSGTDSEGKPFLSRTRYYDVSENAFRMAQDRSFDNGQTWDENVIVIEAKRVSATAPR